MLPFINVLRKMFSLLFAFGLLVTGGNMGGNAGGDDNVVDADFTEA